MEEVERPAKEAAAQEAEAPAEPQPSEDAAPPQPAEELAPEPVPETAPVDAPAAPEPIADTQTESLPEEMPPEPSPPEAEPTPAEETDSEPIEVHGEPAIENEEVPVSKPDKKSPGFLGSKWMLIIGIGLVLAGILSVILMRTNYLQVYLLGWEEPYTGVGRLETPAQFGNTAFYAIGLVMIFVWGMRAEAPEAESKPELDEAEDVREVEEPIEEAPTVRTEEAAEEIPAPVPPTDFGHEHLPPAHLSTIEKIKHLTKAYSQGKISEGLYNENMTKFEAELDAEPDEDEEPASEEEFGHEHLPPAHLSPDDKIDHLTKAYARGKVSKSLYERDLAKFEAELKSEQAHMPPHHLRAQEKIDHLGDSYRAGRISKGTYEKNLIIFKNDLEFEELDAPAEPQGVLTPGEPSQTPEAPIGKATEDDTMKQLDSLMEEIESGNDSPEMREKFRKKKEESFEDKILKEIEDLEDL